MTTSIQISSASEAAEIMEQTRAVQDAERNHAAEHARPNTYVKTASQHSLDVRDGDVSMQRGRAIRASARGPALPPGHVLIKNGRGGTMVAGLEAVKNSDLESLILARADDLSRPHEGAQRQAQADAPEVADDGQDGKGDSTALPGGMTDEEKAALAKAGSAIEQAREAIGPTAVDGWSQDVVASGVLPSEHELPEGVTVETVNAVVAGYTAQADAVLRDVGTNVATLVAMLTPDELREARRATYQNDDAALKRLGRRAMSTLEKLPNDPSMLEAIEKAWPADHRVVHRKDGTAWIETPHYQMPWSQAVKQGLIRY